jgi:RNA-binding protein YlmH
MSGASLDFLSGSSADDRLFARQCADKVRAAEDKYRTGFTFFLTEGKAETARRVMAAFSFERFMLWGGTDSAERVMLGVFAPYDEPSAEAFPIKALTIGYSGRESISHRDILGSLMGLNIARETVGDIYAGEKQAIVFLTNTAADEVMRGLAKVGRESVSVAEGFDPDAVPERGYKEISGTVSSLRADCVLSLAARISRARAEELISSGLMTVKGQAVTKTSHRLEEGDTFSARGYGKFVLERVGGNTKKDRIFIDVKKYI